MQISVPFAPEQASTFAGEVDSLYGILWGLTILFGVGLSLTILYFAVKYRRRDEDEIPRPIRPALRLEVAWTVIPFIVSMGIFVWGASIYYRMYHSPTDALDIYVVAKQWMWKFQHLDGQREINELHIPYGRRIKLTMTTEDVIHAFYVPAFRVKMDIVPGKYSSIWFEPTKPGRYQLFCAEYCGTNHSGMIGWVNVMEPSEYQAWLSGGSAEGSLASTGQKLFSDLACVSCHRSDGQGRGPRLDEVFGSQVTLTDGQKVTADEAYIRESILDPQAKIVTGYPKPSIMPTFRGLVTEEQLLQLITYIKSLHQQQGTSGATSTSVPQSQSTPSTPAGPSPARGAQKPPQ